MDGDSENKRLKRKKRKTKELFNIIAEEFILPIDTCNKEKVDGWITELEEDAEFNFGSYADCFVSENIVRKYIQENGIELSKEANERITTLKDNEQQSKNKGNVSIEIRKKANDLSYLSMNDLAYLVDKKDPLKEACLPRDANEYKPIRDALAHTALLTDVAKSKLTSVYENIKGRIRTLLSSGD